MKTFLVELIVDFDEDEDATEKDVLKIFDGIDPALGIVTVQNITEE